MKKWLIIIALALLTCIVVFVLRSRPEEAIATSVSHTSRGPSFDVRVVVPRAGLPLGGILPDALVKKLDGTPRELRFSHASPGARIGSVAPDRIELSAEGGWDLLIETDGKGGITSATRLVFPLALGGRHLKLRCRPAAPGIGSLETTTRAVTVDLSGRFVLELATCENTASGKTSNWPPAPLTVSGSFAGLPPGSR